MVNDTKQAAATEQVPDWKVQQRRRSILLKMGTTALATFLLAVFLMPMGYAFVTSLKTKQQAADPTAPILPSVAVTFEYEGKEVEVFKVPLPDGETKSLAIVKKGRQESEFVDPDNPEAGIIVWEGQWRTLDPVREGQYNWGNYQEAWDFINFPRLLFWTLLYAFVTMIGAVASSAFVAYGFSRFKFPGKTILFIVLIGTIILPPAVTLIPQYAFFSQINWVGTWLPLIVPMMFGNAYNVFLLRQYFLTIPREMEQAASVDGAGPVRTFIEVILPQAIKISIPPTIGFLVQVVKNTSLTSIIGYVELTRRGQILNNVTFEPFIIFSMVGFIYFVVCYPLSLYSQRLEAQMTVESA
jgi:multiple sugar transport system permease protein